jgi:putative alpha-1,2-mannosidase
MFKSCALAVILCFGLFSCQQPSSDPEPLPDQNYAQYVNPFIGTGGHGHTFPGATVPFGMVQLSPDTRLEGWDGCSGYHHTDSVVYGFSHTHLSGTGVSDYGDILLMPTTGPIQFNNGADGNPGYNSVFFQRKRNRYGRILLDPTRRLRYPSRTDRYPKSWFSSLQLTDRSGFLT